MYFASLSIMMKRIGYCKEFVIKFNSSNKEAKFGIFVVFLVLRQTTVARSVHSSLSVSLFILKVEILLHRYLVLVICEQML